MSVEPAAPTPVPATSEDEPTIGKLVTDVSRDLSSLISKEIALAKSELKVSVRLGGLGAALLAVAAFLGTLAIIMLSFTAVYFINFGGSGLALHWAYLIVTGFWFLLTGLLAWFGIGRLKKVRPPERAIAQGKEIPKALRGRS